MLLQLSDKVPMNLKVQHYFKEFLTALQTGKVPDDDWMNYEAPVANAYESQSGGIIDTLKKLLAEFSDKKGQCEKEDVNAQLASNMILLDLVDSIENANEDIAMKTELKADRRLRLGSSRASWNPRRRCSLRTSLCSQKWGLSANRRACPSREATDAHGGDRPINEHSGGKEQLCGSRRALGTSRAGGSWARHGSGCI